MENTDNQSMEEWKAEMLQNLTSYKERTGKSMATYEEMLELSQPEFNTFLWLKTRPDYINEMIKEMAIHEQKYQTANNRFNKYIVEERIVLTDSENIEDWRASDWAYMMLGIFDPVKSEEVVIAVMNLDETAKEFGYKNSESSLSPLETAIAEKAGKDYAELRN